MNRRINAMLVPDDSVSGPSYTGPAPLPGTGAGAAVTGTVAAAGCGIFVCAGSDTLDSCRPSWLRAQAGSVIPALVLIPLRLPHIPKFPLLPRAA